MPIYEYRCTGCGVKFDVMVPSADAPAPHCRSCGAASVEKLLSAFAVGKSQPGTRGPCGSSDCECRSS